MRSSGSERPSRRVVLGHLAMAAVVWVAAGIVAWLALLTWTGQQLDEWALQAADEVVDPRVSRWLTLALDQLPVAAALLGGSGILNLLLRTRRIAAGAIVLGMAAVSLLSVQALKLLVLSKPDLGIQEATLNSFPSGHASLAAVAGLVWVLAVPTRARGWTAVVAASVTTAIGVMTVLTGWHRPADVVAAILIPAGWCALATLALRSILGRAPSRGSGRPEITKSSLGLFALAAAVAIGVAQHSESHPAWALIAGLLAVGATVLLVFAGIAALARHR